MWDAALETEALQAALAGAGVYEQRILRLFGPPESEIAKTLREAEARRRAARAARDHDLPAARRDRDRDGLRARRPPRDYAAFEAAVLERHGATVFARDGETIDELVAAALLGPPVRTVAVAESCTGGLMAGRLTDRAGSSAYVLGGLTVYSNEAKVALAGVDAGADRAPRRGLARGGGRARRRGDRARSARTSGSGSPGSPGRAAAARPSRSGRSACRWPSAAGRGSTAPSSCPATARWCASARPPSRCTCCGGCSMAPRELSGSSSPSTCPRRRGPRSRRSATPRRTRRVWRPVADEALHVTLVFLGHRPAGESDAVAAVAARRARVRRADLALGAGAAAAAAPRAGAVRGGGGPLGRARGAAGAASAAALAAAGLHEPERRPFRAARHRGAAAGRRARPAPARLGGPEPVAFAGEAADALPLPPVARGRPLRAARADRGSADRPAARCAGSCRG